MSQISYFPKTLNSKESEIITLADFIEKIKTGAWEDAVTRLRVASPEDRDRLKRALPAVTVSGVFKERNDASLTAHSGFIAVDIDEKENPDIVQQQAHIYTDPHVYAGFMSVSGRGLCLIIPIQGKKHREAFEALAHYFLTHYEVIIDAKCVNVSRLRFVSYDPNLYYNPGAVKFTQYLPKEKPPKVTNIIYVQSDFDAILQQIATRRVDITGGYGVWLKIGFALADKFGEAGRAIYHAVSQYYPGYKPGLTDRQFTNCLRANTGKTTIATFYYYCKQAGITTLSPATREAIQAAADAKKAGKEKRAAAEALNKAQPAPGLTVPTPDAQSIIDQVFDQGVNTFAAEDGLVNQIERYLRQNHTFWRNTVSRKIEVDGQPLDDTILNGLFVDIKKLYDKTTFELVSRLIYSPFVKDYNPITGFFKENEAYPYTNQVDQLWAAFKTDDDEKLKHFGTKWLVSIIASAFGQHSPLVLILAGEEQNTGKTQAFRRLLPPELKAYYAESNMDAGKDSEILMSKKLIIMDDEMGGKNRKEYKRLKELTSKQTFSVREPYGRHSVDLNRLAVLCGTSNDLEILTDPTGNRRLLPMQVLSIDHNAYNAVDKKALFIQLYHLYKAGFEWELNKADIEILNKKTADFQDRPLEFGLILRYFALPAEAPTEHVSVLTATEIKIKLEKESNQRISLKVLGQQLRLLGFERVKKRVAGVSLYAYKMVEKNLTGLNTPDNPWQEDAPPVEELPF